MTRSRSSSNPDTTRPRIRRNGGDPTALVAHGGRLPPLAVVIYPLSKPALYRRAVAAVHRTRKVRSYRFLGDFVPPPATQLPSIQC